jgi:hypothetical protein
MMTNKPDLLPCPFCGDADLSWHEDYDRQGAYKSRMTISCGCGVEMKDERWHWTAKDLRKIQRESIQSRWNNRKNHD